MASTPIIAKIANFILIISPSIEIKLALLITLSSFFAKYNAVLVVMVARMLSRHAVP